MAEITTTNSPYFPVNCYFVAATGALSLRGDEAFRPQGGPTLTAVAVEVSQDSGLMYVECEGDHTAFRGLHYSTKPGAPVFGPVPCNPAIDATALEVWDFLQLNGIRWPASRTIKVRWCRDT